MRTSSPGPPVAGQVVLPLAPPGMAASPYAAVPLVLVFLFLQRYLISSLTAGAVKS